MENDNTEIVIEQGNKPINNLQEILILKQKECAIKYDEYYACKYGMLNADNEDEFRKDPILSKYRKVQVDDEDNMEKMKRKYNDLIKMFYCGINQIKQREAEKIKIKFYIENINNDNKLYYIGMLISYCNKKYYEYIFCMYGYDYNAKDYINDSIIQKYQRMRFNYDTLVKCYEGIIQIFDNAIDEKIKTIGRGQLYTQHEWIVLANNRYNNKYDYSKVKYINAQTKVIIVCYKHKEYLQYPHSHLSGYECTDCTKELRGTLIPFEKSFASNEKSKYWSKKNKLKPENVSYGSSEKYIFDCICGHEIIITIGDVKSGYWCAYCAKKKVCSADDCEMCFKNSFASNEKAIYWLDINNCRPRDVLKSSGKSFFFNCDVCKHVIKKVLNSVDYGAWCGYCAHQNLCDNNDCNFCFENSFAPNPMSKYWSKKNNIEPRMCFKNGNLKYIFDCPYCNFEYISVLNGISNGKWCNCIKNKTEAKLFNFLKLNYNQETEKQKGFDWCKNKKHLPFDFCIEAYKLIIECDGAQHFRKIYKWKDPILTQERDKYKMDCANKNGYSVIRIYQEDVWNNKNNWEENLKDAIKKYDIPINVYIGKVYEGVYFNCDE
jgi:hypothetical protein